MPSSSDGDKSDVVVVDKSRLKVGQDGDGEDREWFCAMCCLIVNV